MRIYISKPIVWGFLVGLFISLIIFCPYWSTVAYSHYKQKVFYYDGFTFWQKCKKEGKSDIQAATERYRIVHNQPDFKAEMHPDVEKGHPEAFIRGSLGYELWDGFGYGKKPSLIKTFFARRTVIETTQIISMMPYRPYIAILLSPFVCAAIGYAIAKVRKKLRSHTS